MTLTHEQIAGMNPKEVDYAIAERYKEAVWHIRDDGMGHYSPTTDWRDAGRLLEMMVKDCVAVQVIHIAVFNNWAARYEKTPKIDGDIHFTAPTATEAIARCWLEWWEVTHE